MIEESQQPSKFFDDIYTDGIRIHGRMEFHSDKCRECGFYLINEEKVYCVDCNW